MQGKLRMTIEYTRIEFRPVEDGWRVSVGAYQAHGGHRYPRAVQKPWEHTLSLPPDVTSDEIFRAVRVAIYALGMAHGDIAAARGLGAP